MCAQVLAGQGGASPRGGHMGKAPGRWWDDCYLVVSQDLKSNVRISWQRKEEGRSFLGSKKSLQRHADTSLGRFWLAVFHGLPRLVGNP